MASLKALFISSTIDENRKHIPKGTIQEYDLDVQGHREVLQHFRAAGRIAPPTRENLELCIDELQRSGERIPAALQAAVNAPVKQDRK